MQAAEWLWEEKRDEEVKINTLYYSVINNDQNHLGQIQT